MEKDYKKNRRRPQDALSSFEFGKVPPQAINLEQAVLGALMVDKDALEVIALLSKESFYDERNGLVFEAIEKLASKDKGVDLLTVTDELRKIGELENAGGPFYVTSLTNQVASAAHIEEHAMIVQQKKYMRDIITISQTAMRDAYDDTTDVFELMESVEKGFLDAGGSIVANNIMSLAQVGDEVEKEQEEMGEKNGLGVPTYFNEIDEVGSPQNGDLVVWAARASMGKTSIAISTAIRQAKNGIRVGIMSMEMDRRKIFIRMVCHETGINFKRVISNDMTEEEKFRVEEAKKILRSLPIFIEDAPNQTLAQFKTKVIRMKRKFNVEIVYADHLGKLKIKILETNAYLMVTEIIRGVKSLARTLDIPIIMLVQLSRKVENTKEMRPMLSSLKDSGAIEEEADQVGLIYRPEYYHNQGISGFDTVLVDGQVIESKGYAEINYAKNRNGEAKIVKLRYIDSAMKFDDFNVFDRKFKPIQQPVNYHERAEKADDIEEGLPF